MRLFAPLANRRIAWLWAGQVGSVIGDNLYGVALAWFAVSLVGGNATYLVAAQALSIMLAGMIGGTLADRLDRRSLMVALDAIRVVAVLILPVVDVLHLPLSLPLVYGVAILMAALGAIFDPTLQVAMTGLARNSGELRALNALTDGTKRVARIGSSGIIALCASFLPVTHFFTLDSVTFLISIATLLKAGQLHPPAQPLTVARPHWLSDLRLAVRLAITHPWLRFNLLGTALGFASWMIGAMIGLSLLLQATATRSSSGGLDLYGITIGIYAAASLLCNLALGNMKQLPVMRTMLLGRCLMGLGYMSWLLAPNLTWLSIGAVLAGLGSPMIDIPFFELIRRTTAPDHVGKIFALRIVMQNLGIVVATVVATPLLNLIGAGGLIALFGLLNVGTAFSGAFRFRGSLRDDGVLGELTAPGSASIVMEKQNKGS
ncbi:MAG TPA: MFS transporter [Dongiaceae bacterium]|nr:MFS transporter [Dongiaceae bacterium]